MLQQLSFVRVLMFLICSFSSFFIHHSQTQGAIQGPSEFAEGLVLGVKSLFGHTVGGAAGAVSK